MVAPPEPLSLRKTVIGGQTAPDDWLVIWNGISIGRILRQPGMPSGRPNWSWGVILPNKPQHDWMRGTCSDLEDCKRRFRVAWSALHPKLTDADVEQLRHPRESTRPWNKRK
ncbi:hypothetical protein IVB45_17630 [Bradyrhizobium sp. 4]|uniref:hypothetical protein n=1 Tax=unclassified Bradyrhizobium TaxID=2631580 RepID=UPI001FF87FA4|nr:MULTISPECIES: hypothetical protein [unclassified Bradyrhizobium]MCK1402003.1 hypothetical protein [Bradyrhizobium sp. 39]MCK1751277.1 hypothetical protein [Bradyrhizobium sp. 135]UPJ38528.1 hypothetical protein IVB45_17630 [Bradyrhizobium sp. 4]